LDDVDLSPSQPCDDPAPSSDGAGVSRRDFFGLTWRALAAVLAGQAACVGLRFLASRPAEESQGQVLIAGLVSDFPPGTITPFEQARFFLIRFADGGFLALSVVCPHLACVVGWDGARGRFTCPCHGSEFERDGRVVNPPAPRPLDRYTVLIENDRVKVDTRQVLRRTQTDAADLVYAPSGAADTASHAPPVVPFHPGQPNP